MSKTHGNLCAVIVSAAMFIMPGVLPAYDSHCGNDTITCDDGYAQARTRWGVDSTGQFVTGAEHARIWLRSRELSGLPASLDEPIVLEVFVTGNTINSSSGAVYDSYMPARKGARATIERTTSLAEMTMLPDEAYNLWDWSSGNELCPPDSTRDPEFCHNYKFHMGPLNRNHMVPQSQRFYEHYHELALDRASTCKNFYSSIPDPHKDRFVKYVKACEQEAMVLEAIGHHFMQDAWSMGHTWEAWGGTEVSDFGGNLTLGALIAAYVGTIHGAKAMMSGLHAIIGADDPMCAPNENVLLADSYAPLSITPIQAAGDIFLDDIFNNTTFEFQRKSLLGCSVSGMREVYGATAQVHGVMGIQDFAEIDSSRVATTDSCWSHRATNLALATGFGIHRGWWPNQETLIPGIGVVGVLSGTGNIVSSSYLRFLSADLQNLPPLDVATQNNFLIGASYAATLAAFKAAYPPTRLDTDLASGGLPPIAGIQPNGFYARGGAAQPGILPNSYSDPFLPWNLDETDPIQQKRKEVLSLTFSDAHVEDRCGLFQVADLEEYRSLSSSSQSAKQQCAEFIVPHLRHGKPGDYDANREALCTFISPNAAFVYTDEDPGTFTGNEPRDLGSLLAAALQWCESGTDPMCTDFGQPNSGTFDGTASGTFSLNMTQIDSMLSGTVSTSFGGTHQIAGTAGCNDFTVQETGGLGWGQSGTAVGDCWSGTWAATSVNASGTWQTNACAP